MSFSEYASDSPSIGAGCKYKHRSTYCKKRKTLQVSKYVSPLRGRKIHSIHDTVKPGYNEFDGTRENIPYNQKFLITKVTFITKIIIIYN